MNNKDKFEILIGGFDEGFFKVDFCGRFNEAMLDAVRNVPGRRWNNEEKLWLIPDSQAAVNELLGNIFATGLFNDEEKAPPSEAIVFALTLTPSFSKFW